MTLTQISNETQLDTTPPARVGPVFVCGRQHCGNTVVARMIAGFPGCFGITNEGIFFEHRGRLDAMKDPIERARWIVEHLWLKDEQLLATAVEHITRWAGQHRDADALAAYVEAMRFLTHHTGDHFWSQKATSYIFYGHEILQSMPDVRIIYLIRNPHDVCASKKRRDPDHERIVSWAVSWNKGLRIAKALEQAYPDRVLLLKYEDLVSQPPQTVRSICGFLGVPFRDEYLDVPVINTAEAQYKVVQDAPRGFDKSRLFNYPKHLTPAEMAALDLVLDNRLVRTYYPDMPHREQRVSCPARLAALRLVAVGPLRYLWGQVQFARTCGAPFAARLMRRLAR